MAYLAFAVTKDDKVFADFGPSKRWSIEEIKENNELDQYGEAGTFLGVVELKMESEAVRAVAALLEWDISYSRASGYPYPLENLFATVFEAGRKSATK